MVSYGFLEVGVGAGLVLKYDFFDSEFELDKVEG
jgi:hypothetical protein